jgi:transposase InsO family protein/transposase-like protein
MDYYCSMNLKYQDELKKEIIDLFQAGMTVDSICKKYQLSKSSVYSWIKLDKMHKSKNGAMQISFREVISLQSEVARLRQENEIFRKCKWVTAAPLSKKLKAIDELQHDYSIHVLCKTLNVLRSTYYHYSLRSPEKTVYEINDEEIRPIVKQIFDESKGRFGTRKLKAALEQQGYIVSLKRLRRFMKELNISCKQTQLKYFSSSNRKYMYRRNTLKQQFLQSAPNLVWASDITYMRVGKDFYAICAVIDLFSRKVIAYDTSINNNTELVISTFKKAFEARDQPDGLLFHSDQGVQYTAYKFRTLLRKLKVKQSSSYPGMPLDNAVAESFFSSMKVEELSHHFYEEPKDLIRDIEEYVNYFNSKRIHQRLGYKTPDQVEKMYQDGELEQLSSKPET